MVRLTADGAPPGLCRLESATVSWMPATLDIRPLAVRPEPGRNLELHETLGLVLRSREQISQWGPYEVSRASYDNFMRQYANLKEGEATGRVQYHLFDVLPRPGAVNCIRAVTDIDPEFGRSLAAEGTAYGDQATYLIVEQLFARGRVIQPGARHDWLERALGLDRYPIDRLIYVPRQYYYRQPAPPLR
jgi:hypothetical protein